jgi:sulfur-oxidizing protein SoxB
LGVLDLELGKGAVKDVRYHLLPIYSDLLKPDADMQALIERVRKPHAAAFDAKIATAGELLYRRGNFNGTVDQLICDALRAELGADLSLSPGFRWGNTLLPGEAITMDDLLSETAITYPQVYVQEMTGQQIKGIMEDVCDNLFNPDPYYQQGGDMVRIGGMDYSCAPAETIGHRISDLTLDDGKPLEPGKTYRVAGWASVNPQEGRPVTEVVASYLRNAQDARPKKLNKVAVKGLANNPGIAG